jgi:pyruvate,water dikinase
MTPSPLIVPLIVPLDALLDGSAVPHCTLSLLGGKALSLARLTAEQFPVPEGFTLTTAAYDSFVAFNDLSDRIAAAAGTVGSADGESAAAASATIAGLFETGEMPEELASLIVGASSSLGDEPVAVRSSATAEDLPEHSFAGQQDSFLNVSGVDALLTAVRRCWASLWSNRALVYRARAGIDPGEVSIAVVIQKMVPADRAGVLFTADPATGDKQQLLVNASLGLGETVVSGAVTADVFRVARKDLKTVEVRTGDKRVMTVPAAGGATETVPVSEGARVNRSLSDHELSELARLALRAEDLFDGVPQDVEWALADGKAWILQSRAITGLPEPLSWESPYGDALLIRRQVVENMPEPLSPLFEQLYLNEGLDLGMDQLIGDMKLPFNVDDFIRRPMFVTVNGYGYSRYEFNLTWKLLVLIPRVLAWYVAVLPGWLREMVPLWRDQGLAGYLKLVDAWRERNPDALDDAALLEGVRQLARADARYWFYITMVVGAAKVTEGLFGWALRRCGRQDLTSGMFLRGFPSRTLDAQRRLEEIAAAIRSAGGLPETLTGGGGRRGRLQALMEAHPGTAEALAAYRSEFGHLVFNLDFAAPTQGEDPSAVLQRLEALILDPGESADELLAERVRERQALEAEVRTSFGRFRGWLFRKTLGWAQRFGPLREEALFYMGAAWPILRALALTLGTRLTESGCLARPEQVFLLRAEELEAASRGRLPADEALARAAAREALMDRRRRVHPPGRVPPDASVRLGPIDVTRFFETWETQKRNDPDARVLEGFAVSPGVVTGTVSVILSPNQFPEMGEGTILVCPTTTPAWTPLFGRAVALVTDIGAVLAHGSIVAREYGIPAVLGTGNGTERLVSGQRVRVDGNRGTVTLLD